MYRFKLYVTGQAGSFCERTGEQLEKTIRERFGRECEFHVRDIVECAEEADEDGILATPTLIRVQPPPVCRMVGNFSDASGVIERLAG